MNKQESFSHKLMSSMKEEFLLHDSSPAQSSPVQEEKEEEEAHDEEAPGVYWFSGWLIGR